jgi:hypothetical protein
MRTGTKLRITAGAVAAITSGVLLTAAAAPAEAAAPALYGGKGMLWTSSTGSQTHCTIGFNVVTVSGRTMTLSAGHCGKHSDWQFGSMSPAYSWGPTVKWKFAPSGDFQVIKDTDGFKKPGAVRYYGRALPVYGHEAAHNGMQVCWRGDRTEKTACGTVYDAGKDTRLNYGTRKHPKYMTFHNTFKVNNASHCGHHGDSGAPMYEVKLGSSHEPYAVAVGILQGVPDTCGQGWDAEGQPVSKILAAWHLKIKNHN